MDILYFLRRRTGFVRHLFETAGKPFRDTLHAIEAEEPPYDDSPCNEDGEPPFIEEWIQASDSLDVLGRACLSMLSPTLQLYFQTWEHELGIPWCASERKRAFSKGFFRGYQIWFREVLNQSWSDCPADFKLIEQIALARNRDQHPDSIASLQVHHTPRDLKKYPRPFFVSDLERAVYADMKMQGSLWITPAVHVSEEMLYVAIVEVENLAEWLEARLFAVKNGT